MKQSKDQCAATIEEVAAAIERYLAAHPHAADTAEGIATWWLPEQTFDRKTIDAALDWMVQAGTLQTGTLGVGRRWFRQPAGTGGPRT